MAWGMGVCRVRAFCPMNRSRSWSGDAQAGATCSSGALHLVCADGKRTLVGFSSSEVGSQNRLTVWEFDEDFNRLTRAQETLKVCGFAVLAGLQGGLGSMRWSCRKEWLPQCQLCSPCSTEDAHPLITSS